MERQTLRNLTLVAFFAALTAVGAFIKIPFPGVPFTLQTTVVVLSGALLGMKLGAASQIVYLAVGLFGLPIFAQGGGPGYIMQPTFGYLMGFPLSACLAGILTHRVFMSETKWRFIKLMIAQLGALVPMFLVGIFYLYINLKYIQGSNITILHAIWSGCIIFLPMDVIKIALSALLTLRLTDLIRTNYER